MASPYYTEYEEQDATKIAKKPDSTLARPAATQPSGSEQRWKMPRLPGPFRRIHKLFGRRVKTHMQENY